MKSFVVALALGGLSAPLAAGPVVPISVAIYDTPNGSGQASGGTFNYWDKAYNGFGDTTVDGAPLTSGWGDLSDGKVATDIWFNVETVAGDGPYVGWRDFRTPAPALTFYLLPYADPGYFVVTGIAIHMDNSQFGGVHAPGEILVNGVATSFTPPAPGTIGWAELFGWDPIIFFSLTPVTLELAYSQPGWIFLSEVQFSGIWVDDPGGVPEPATWAMLVAGFGVVGAAARRRRRQPLAT